MPWVNHIWLYIEIIVNKLQVTLHRKQPDKITQNFNGQKKKVTSHNLKSLEIDLVTEEWPNVLAHDIDQWNNLNFLQIMEMNFQKRGLKQNCELYTNIKTKKDLWSYPWK